MEATHNVGAAKAFRQSKECSGCSAQFCWQWSPRHGCMQLLIIIIYSFHSTMKKLFPLGCTQTHYERIYSHTLHKQWAALLRHGECVQIGADGQSEAKLASDHFLEISSPRCVNMCRNHA